MYYTTFYHGLNKIFQIGNKMELIGRQNNLYRAFYIYIYIIIKLRFFIIYEYHEILGNYLREYLRLL